MPKVSVITCTYNRAHLIGQSIDSVLHQTFRDLEYIIVDDGSTDNTADVIELFDDPRIKYFSHPRTGGHLSKLRNFAHHKCSGEFIAYIDSDDLWEKDKLEIQLAGLAENPKVGFSFTDIDIFNDGGIIRKTLYNKKGMYTGSVFDRMLQGILVICHTTLLLRSSCLAITGPMDETLHSGDHDMVFFLSRYFDAFVVYRQLVHVRKHDQNSTASHSLNLRLLKEHHRTLKKLFDKKLISLPEYKRSYATTSYSFGVQLLPAGDHGSAVEYFFKSLKIRPLHLKSWARLLQTLLKQIFSF